MNPFARRPSEAEQTLIKELDCLCRNVEALARAVNANSEQVALMQHRLDRIWGAIDRAELYAHEHWGYPTDRREYRDPDGMRKVIEEARRL